MSAAGTLDPVVLILPGRGNSGPAHWQTRWERQRPGCVRIEQSEWTTPRRDDWVASLQRTVAALAPVPRAHVPRAGPPQGSPVAASTGHTAAHPAGERTSAV